MAHFMAYLESRAISRTDPGFYGLLFAMIRKADDVNLALIERAWPWAVDEFRHRYDAAGGALTANEKAFLEKSTIKPSDRWPKKG